MNVTNIPLDAIPNQEISVRLEDFRYTLKFNDLCPGTLCATVSRNDVLLISGVRCVAKELVLPYQYLEGTGGNFYFETPNDEIPDYTKFGSTHFLYYISAAELEAARE